MQPVAQPIPRGYTTISHCRACGSHLLEHLFSIGNQSVSDFVPIKKVHSGNQVPISLVRCERCTLIQQLHTAPQELLYTRHYWYRSGVTDTMKRELADITKEASRYVDLAYGHIVLDIGSNDGTLLRSYTQSGVVKVGIEPATNLQEEGKQGIDILVNDFWDGYKYYEALMNSPFQDISKTGSCKPRVITACGMFYDLSDPNPFIKDIADYLHPEGVFIAQLMCAKQMYNLRDIGNLCHEHLEFYTLESLKQLFHKYRLKIVEIQENKVNGGSYRLFVQHNHATVKRHHQEDIDKYLEDESKYIHSRSRWIQWIDDINKNLNNVYNFILGEKLKGKRTYVIGASTKGNVILQAMGLSNTEIDGASERSWEKCGLYTIGSGIPIHSEEYVRTQKPDYLLCLPYAFLQEIIGREIELRNQGTKFIVPIPEFRVV